MNNDKYDGCQGCPLCEWTEGKRRQYYLSTGPGVFFEIDRATGPARLSAQKYDLKSFNKVVQDLRDQFQKERL